MLGAAVVQAAVAPGAIRTLTLACPWSCNIAATSKRAAHHTLSQHTATSEYTKHTNECTKHTNECTKHSMTQGHRHRHSSIVHTTHSIVLPASSWASWRIAGPMCELIADCTASTFATTLSTLQPNSHHHQGCCFCCLYGAELHEPKFLCRADLRHHSTGRSALGTGHSALSTQHSHD